jgi:hypothetical protein
MGKYLTNNAGQLQEANSVAAFVGAADAGKIPELNGAGVIAPALLNAKNSSAGAGDAGKLVQLDAAGRIDATMMPVGIGADTATLTASEALASGDLINVWNDAGTPKVRKADASTPGKEAHGFVTAAYALNAAAVVYFEGTNTQMTGLTAGRQYLSATVPGKTQAAAPSTAGQVVQVVGFATAATAMNFQSQPPITLA